MHGKLGGVQRLLAVALVVFAGCGDNLKAKLDGGGLPDVSAEFLMRLSALPNVHDVV